MRSVSIDEMTGIQALERAAATLAMRPGLVERREYEYRRHGTQCLIAAFDVATGKVIGAIGPRRTEADYVRFLEALLTSAPEDTRWVSSHFVILAIVPINLGEFQPLTEFFSSIKHTPN